MVNLNIDGCKKTYARGQNGQHSGGLRIVIFR